MQLQPSTGRRSFLRSLASFGFAVGLGNSEKPQEKVYRIRTPECEVRMSVQYFGNSLKSFRFRERLSEHSFCLSADGSEGQDCLQRFTGSVAIAYYHLLPHSHTQPLSGFRERVVTIDHDDQMNPRPPFERALAIQRDMVSDIQAFGYSSDLPKQEARPGALWCLLRQNLYLNDQTAPFLIVHWKHTLEFIQLVDLIPGGQTQIVDG